MCIKYIAERCILAQMRGPDTEVIEGIEIDYTEKEDSLLIVIAGTDSLYDIFSKSWDCSPVTWPGRGKVHSGYYRVACDIFYTAKRIHNNLGKDFILAGHSMGGSIARMIAYILKEEGQNVTGLYTFGEPQSLSTGFKAPEVLTHRYVCGSDRVPKCFKKFEHLEDPILLEKPIRKILGPVLDHRMVAYWRELR